VLGAYVRDEHADFLDPTMISTVSNTYRRVNPVGYSHFVGRIGVRVAICRS